jgi:hypothetical protein
MIHENFNRISDLWLDRTIIKAPEPTEKTVTIDWATKLDEKHPRWSFDELKEEAERTIGAFSKQLTALREVWDGIQPSEYARQLAIYEIMVNVFGPSKDAPKEITHLCPPGGSGIMPCCGKTPFEVPRTDRMTEDKDKVTCNK